VSIRSSYLYHPGLTYLLARMVDGMGQGASIFLANPPLLEIKPRASISSYPHIFFIIESYPLLAGFANVLIGFEEGSNVHGLASPQISMNRPVERQLQRASVQRPESNVNSNSSIYVARQSLTSRCSWST
jgi:hypothetical protein